MDPEKLERIQLPAPSEAEKTTYNHLLAERLIRIMNNAAQPGAWGVWAVHRVVQLGGPGSHTGRQEPWAPDLALPGTQADVGLSLCHTRLCLG